MGLHARSPVLAAILPGLVLVLVGSLGFVVMLDSVIEQDDFTRLDEPVLSLLVGLRGPTRTAFFTAVTVLSGPVVLPIAIAVVALVWGLRAHEVWRPALLAGAVAFASLTSLVIKAEVARPRPPLDAQHIPGAESTFSFPSGHTIGTATLCLVGGYLLWSRRRTRASLLWWAGISVAATGAVGLSRLYLGYHFVTDVLAASALAVAVLGVVVAVDRLYLLRSGSPSPPTPARPTRPGTPPAPRR